MATIDASHGSLDRALGELVAERPARARVFERLGIDYCCHGHRSLLDASTEAGLDPVPHLAKEEQVLFPAIKEWADGQRSFAFGTLANPVRMMMIEHDRAGELLERLRAATDGYQPPDDGCASYQTLYDRLAHLEQDTHRHVHLENNVLFPAVTSDAS